MIIGGGDVALRKANILIKAQADLTLIADKFNAQLLAYAKQNKCKCLIEIFKPEHLDNVSLVIAATDDSQLNTEIAGQAQHKNIPVNVVDQPALCSFIMPAIVDRSPVVVAISSSGKSPVLTRKIKELNETHIAGREGELAELLGAYRSKVKEQIDDFEMRIKFWESILASEIPELVYSGKSSEAKTLIASRIDNFDQANSSGEVYLVGAGPGDPELLTLKALRIMYKADVVLYDRLVSAEIMARIRPDAETIHVGKARSKHLVEQEAINEMLIRYASEGKRVLRLKGGDPFIFGRGGEEIESLAKAGIPFQIIPGITAASGCASYAGIPLTHRDYAQSVRFLTGHLKDGTLDLDWKSMLSKHETLVFYMGLVGLNSICEKLVENGKDPETPIAVIQQGTTQTQKVYIADLKSMPSLAQSNEIKAPTIIIIGEVVRLRDTLSWYLTET